VRSSEHTATVSGVRDADERPLAVNGENSRAKVQNVRGDSSAGRRETEPVGPRHRRTVGSSPVDGEFVPQDDNFQVFELIRPTAQDRELQHPSKRPVTQREQHETSEAAGLFYASASDCFPSLPGCADA
jgi:hypothetical protein